MDQEILNSYSSINHLNVSRETFLDFENYISMILEKNKKINIISQNTASKKAAKRLGFKFEGVFRQMFIFKGRNRDSAWFSIIDKEWKKHKKKYLSFLKKGNFDDKLKQKRKLII